jgi:hypothetical protein
LSVTMSTMKTLSTIPSQKRHNLRHSGLDHCAKAGHGCHAISLVVHSCPSKLLVHFYPPLTYWCTLVLVHPCPSKLVVHPCPGMVSACGLMAQRRGDRTESWLRMGRGCLWGCRRALGRVPGQG